MRTVFSPRFAPRYWPEPRLQPVRLRSFSMKGEERLQRQVVEYLRVGLPDSVVWTHFPAGGGGKVRGAKLKAMGLRPGFPDLLFVWRDGERTKTAWIELKTARGRESAAQREVRKSLALAGCATAICRDLDAVIGTLKGWGLWLRAEAA